MIKTKIFDIREVRNDFKKIKEIKNLLDNGYIVLIYDEPPRDWGHYSLYNVEDLIWFIEWITPKFINKIKEL